MRRRPAALFVASLIFLYFPLELFWRCFATNFIPSGFDVVLSVVLPSALIIGLLRVTKIGWYTLVALVALWGVRDLYQYYQDQSAGIRPLAAHLFIYLTSLGYFINPRVRHVYFDPKLRWWRSKPRYETHTPLLIQGHSKWYYPILRNISEGGCFIETSHLLNAQDSIQITIPLPIPLNVSVIRTEGEVRWVSSNPLRLGMGVQFKNTSPEHTKAIKEYVKRQL